MNVGELIKLLEQAHPGQLVTVSVATEHETFRIFGEVVEVNDLIPDAPFEELTLIVDGEANMPFTVNDSN